MSLYVLLVLYVFLSKKNNGGDPSILITVFMIKTFGYDFPKTTIRVLDDDPQHWPRNFQDSMKNNDVEFSPCSAPFASRDFQKANCLKFIREAKLGVFSVICSHDPGLVASFESQVGHD